MLYIESSSGIGKLQLVGPALVLVNKVLMEHGHTHHLHIVWGHFHATMGRAE